MAIELLPVGHYLVVILWEKLQFDGSLIQTDDIVADLNGNGEMN